MHAQKNPCEHTVQACWSVQLDAAVEQESLETFLKGEQGGNGEGVGGGEVSPLDCLCSCLCTLLKPVSERDRCPQNSCLCLFFFSLALFIFFFLPSLLFGEQHLLTVISVSHISQTHRSSSAQWAAKLVREVSRSYRQASLRFFLSFLACVLLFQLYLGFLLSLLFDLFSPSSLSLGPWQLLSQCFPPRASGRGGWVERERERERKNGSRRIEN